MENSKTNGDNYSLWGLICLEKMCDRIDGKEPRANETVCYIALNGNRNALEDALKQRKECEDSCITWYDINDAKHRAEICIEGYRNDLVIELEKLGISREDIEIS